MNNKFTIINSKSDNNNNELARMERVIKTYDGWKRQLTSRISKILDKKIENLTQTELAQIGLAGIKWMVTSCNIKRELEKKTGYVESFDEKQSKLDMISYIFNIISFLTPRNLVTTFPIEKIYDGDKWGCKDFFSTMEELSKFDWDKPLGKDSLLKLLWDYENKDLREVYLEYISDISAIYKSQTGKGIAEEWCDNMGIPTYTADKETGIIKNNSTGKISKLKNVSHITVIK